MMPEDFSKLDKLFQQLPMQSDKRNTFIQPIMLTCSKLFPEIFNIMLC